MSSSAAPLSRSPSAPSSPCSSGLSVHPAAVGSFLSWIIPVALDREMRQEWQRRGAGCRYTRACHPREEQEARMLQMTALGGWRSRGASVGFFSTDAAAGKAAGAEQRGAKPAVAAVAASGGAGEGGGRDGKSEQAGAGKSVRGWPVSWLSFVLLLVTGGGIIVYCDKENKRHIEELKNKTNSVKPGQSVGTATIGGPFTFLNHDGKPVTEKDFVGKWTLLYFGFTYYPDICPDELRKMAAAINKIKGCQYNTIISLLKYVGFEKNKKTNLQDIVVLKGADTC